MRIWRPLLTCYMSLVYGFLHTYITDVIILINHRAHPSEVFHGIRFITATISAGTIFATWIDDVQWILARDAYRTTYTTWKMSLASFVIVNFIYPWLVFFFTESFLMSMSLHPPFVFQRLFLCPPVAILLTYMQEHDFINYKIRDMLIQDLPDAAEG